MSGLPETIHRDPAERLEMLQRYAFVGHAGPVLLCIARQVRNERRAACANAIRILYSIDRQDLVEAGAIAAGDIAAWHAFRDDPPRYFIAASDSTAAAIWKIIEQRSGASR